MAVLSRDFQKMGLHFSSFSEFPDFLLPSSSSSGDGTPGIDVMVLERMAGLILGIEPGRRANREGQLANFGETKGRNDNMTITTFTIDQTKRNNENIGVQCNAYQVSGRAFENA